LPPMPNNMEQLEEMALNQRPELREEDYKKRISTSDARRALISTLPGLSFDMSRQYDSNKFLANNLWAESGLRLSMSLFRMASIPALNRQADAQGKVDDTRRMAQAMAALTQVRVASQRYGLAKEELEQVADSANVDQRLANYAKAAASSRVDSELEVIRTEARALLSAYQRHVAYANAQAAFGRIFNSVGYDIKTPPPNADLATIQQAVEESLAEWTRLTFQRSAEAPAPLPKVSLVIENPKDAKAAAAVRDGATAALARYGIAVTEEPAGWKMVVRVGTDSAGKQHRATWNMVLHRPNGTRAGQMSYSSVVTGDMPASAVNALTQSAIDSYSVAMTDWLGDPNRNVAGTIDSASVQ
jgi:Outer membrane efflux protein